MLPLPGRGDNPQPPHSVQFPFPPLQSVQLSPLPPPIILHSIRATSPLPLASFCSIPPSLSPSRFTHHSPLTLPSPSPCQGACRATIVVVLKRRPWSATAKGIGPPRTPPSHHCLPHHYHYHHRCQTPHFHLVTKCRRLMEGVCGVGGGRGGGGGGGVDNAMMAMDNGGDGTRCFQPKLGVYCFSSVLSFSIALDQVKRPH